MKIGRFSFSKFKKQKTESLNNFYTSDDWSAIYNSGSRRRRKRSKYGGWKTFYRIVVALGIFAVLLVLKESTHPWSQQAREGLKVALTTEWDVVPALDKAVQIGLQTVNMDWPLFHEFSNPVLPAMSESKGEGSWAIPVSGRVVQEFGWTKSPQDNLERFNPGIDIGAAAGSPVKAVQAGKVNRIGYDRIYGEFVLVEHRKGEYSLYAGLTDISVQQGQQVETGQVIGKVAQPDRGEPVLHFEVRENDKLVDPLRKINLSAVPSEKKSEQKITDQNNEIRQKDDTTKNNNKYSDNKKDQGSGKQ